MDPTNVRGVLDAFGFQIPAMSINPVLLVGIIVATYWTRRVTTWTNWPGWVDAALCAGGPYAWGVFYLLLVEKPLGWAELLNWGLVYAAFAGVAYSLFARRLLEAAWGPVNGA
jgi:hypothetical protein